MICSTILNYNGWPGILCQGQSIQGQGHKMKAKAKAGQSQSQGQKIWS